MTNLQVALAQYEVLGMNKSAHSTVGYGMAFAQWLRSNPVKLSNYCSNLEAATFSMQRYYQECFEKTQAYARATGWID